MTSGQYTVVIDTLNKPYTAECLFPGLDSTVVLSGSNPLETQVNFNLKCKPGFDVGVQSVGPVGVVFPGQLHVLNARVGDMSDFYNMSCADGIAGNITITVDGPVTFQNATAGSLIPTISGNTYTYAVPNFGDINPELDFKLDFQTDTTAIEGDQICVTVAVTPLDGDSQPTNNNYALCYSVTNSYDPNNKVVYPTEILPEYSDYLTYTINFQNTGNAPAFNIRLEDSLSTYLDMSSFAVTDYSHDMHYLLSGNKLIVYFPNIMLLDSTTSEPESKGHITYKIKLLPGISDGNLIENTAYIFFDFNPAIVTNTALTTVTEGNHIAQQTERTSVAVYPNPTNGLLCLRSSDRIIGVQIIDQQGRLIPLEPSDDLSKINLSKIESGIYFVKVTTENKQETVRIIKN